MAVIIKKNVKLTIPNPGIRKPGDYHLYPRGVICSPDIFFLTFRPWLLEHKEVKNYGCSYNESGEVGLIG